MRHGLDAIMLADPDLSVTSALGLRNDSALGPKGIGPLPIPTTVLIDADGIVRWIDQASDYQIRSGPDRVGPAIAAALA